MNNLHEIEQRLASAYKGMERKLLSTEEASKRAVLILEDMEAVGFQLIFEDWLVDSRKASYVFATVVEGDPGTALFEEGKCFPDELRSILIPAANL